MIQGKKPRGQVLEVGRTGSEAGGTGQREHGEPWKEPHSILRVLRSPGCPWELAVRGPDWRPQRQGWWDPSGAFFRGIDGDPLLSLRFPVETSLRVFRGPGRLNSYCGLSLALGKLLGELRAWGVTRSGGRP